MSGVPLEAIDGWVIATSALPESVRADPSDEHLAGEAVASLWSGFGYQDAPSEVQRMLLQAIETGYLPALRDVPAGALDEQLLEWRPGPAEIG